MQPASVFARAGLGLAAGLIAAGLVPALATRARAQDSPPPSSPPPSSPQPGVRVASPADRARVLLDQLREASLARRESAARDLVALAAAEDEAPGGERPVHRALVAALRSTDAEVRFRVRRILCDPELNVARTLELLTRPLPTEEVESILRDLAERPDRPAVRSGLIRVARRAARSGLEAHANEEWRPYGPCHLPELIEHQRFVLACDLLRACVVTEEDARAVADLVREDVGATLGCVLEALSPCPRGARAALRDLLRDPVAGTRERAALGLGELGNAEDVPALDLALQDPEPRVRRAVVAAFELMPVEAAACSRAAALAADRDPRVAAAAIHLGASRGLRFVAEPAERLLAPEKARRPGDDDGALEAAREHAARALGRLAAPGAGAVLRPLLGGTGKLACWAAWGLGTAGNPEDGAALEPLATADGAAEPAVYNGLARLGAVDLLLRIVKLGSDEGRRQALAALGSAKGDPSLIASTLEESGTRALADVTTSWAEFETVCRALRDRRDAPARASFSRLLDRAWSAAQRQNEGNTIRHVLELAQEIRATECTLRVEAIVLSPARDRRVEEVAIDVLSTLDPARARSVLARALRSGLGGRDLRPILARGLARAGDPSQVSIALEESRAKVALHVQKDAAELPGDLNSLGIDETYAQHVPAAILCFERMRWMEKADAIAAYNIACCRSLAKQPDDALRWLRRSLCEGFRDWRHIEGDADLLNISEDPRFKRLIEEMRLEQEVEPAPPIPD